MNSDLQSITSRDTACDEAFRRHPHDPAAIEEYRTAKYEIAADILRLHEQAEKPDSDSELTDKYATGIDQSGLRQHVPAGAYRKEPADPRISDQSAEAV